MGYIGIPNLNIVDTITDETPRNAIPSVSALEGLAGEATNLDAAVRYVDNIPTDETELQELKDSLVDGAYVHAINENSSSDGTNTTNVSPRNLGEIVYSPLPLADASLHLADGSLIDSNSSYASAVTNLTTLYNDMPDAPCWATEEDWQAEFTQYGACAKWVINTEAGTIRIPNLTGFVEGTVNEEELGRLIEAGLPDHNHDLSIRNLYAVASSNPAQAVVSQGLETAKAGIEYGTYSASESSPIYGASETVQPQAMRVYVYVCLLPGLSTAAADIKQDVANVVRAVETAQERANAAYEKAEQADGVVSLKSTCTTTGDWEIEGLTVGKPVVVGVKYKEGEQNSAAYITVRSGSDIGLQTNNSVNRFICLGRTNSYISACSTILVPTNEKLIISVDEVLNGASLYAYQ